ncbi:hypothetical protein EV421DRAFT_1740751 [Armillaria borealis]|uniref:Uncharacterized protein n=1 Tax=Armillaria borealis TaxID=47425 RepID=A0AA39J5L0_9AGAR|nr:hypothetical protein EV421DRAFT_1740751 [Armillaria borealis]
MSGKCPEAPRAHDSINSSPYPPRKPLIKAAHSASDMGHAYNTLSLRPSLVPAVDGKSADVVTWDYEQVEGWEKPRSPTWVSFDGRGADLNVLLQGDQSHASKYPFPTVCAENQARCDPDTPLRPIPQPSHVHQHKSLLGAQSGDINNLEPTERFNIGCHHAGQRSKGARRQSSR